MLLHISLSAVHITFVRFHLFSCFLSLFLSLSLSLSFGNARRSLFDCSRQCTFGRTFFANVDENFDTSRYGLTVGFVLCRLFSLHTHTHTQAMHMHNDALMTNYCMQNILLLYSSRILSNRSATGGNGDVQLWTEEAA
jgi:hypothetical protein